MLYSVSKHLEAKLGVVGVVLLHLRAQPGAVSFFELYGYVEMVQRHKWLYSCSKCIRCQAQMVSRLN
uniref:Uncharacterized protein n=1 Tax=Arundo donax TaxID=35708 RepID=A0A0A9CNF0_ARUDO